VKGIWRWRGEVLDVVVIVMAVAAVLEILLRDLPRPQWLLPAVALYTLPLLAHRRWPFAAPVFVIVVQTLSTFIDAPGGEREDWGVFAYLLAFWVLGRYNPLPVALGGLALGLSGIVVVTVEDVQAQPGDAISVAVIGSLAWTAAALLRRFDLRAAEAEERATALEREHHDSQLAVAGERARIARELHDVVAHSVSVMTVQAGAARMLLATDPQRAVAPLLAVEETGRQALTELRLLLGILRADQGGAGLVPQPGVDDLPELVETIRVAGLPVELVTAGLIRPIAPGLGLAAYRIVQEALTNALKHADARQVRVLVGYDEDRLNIEVRDDGRRPRGQDGPAGHGLIGMRERAAVYGGVLEAAPGADGGFSVRASLPIPRLSS
jgi:signal transduction histidine kinase